MGLIYPPTYTETLYEGIYPVDFTIQSILQMGLDWFRSDANAPSLVFGHFQESYLSKYSMKPTEIVDFIKKYKLTIVQHFSLIAQQSPCISIQLLNASEDTSRAGLNDHVSMVDVLNDQNQITGRTEIGYTPVTDNLHIGIHCNQGPDLTKYIYYLVVYILLAYKPDLEDRGLLLGTFQATDLSKLNEYLPENMFSRFINFTVQSYAAFSKGAVPMITSVTGLSIPTGIGLAEIDSDDPIPLTPEITLMDTD